MYSMQCDLFIKTTFKNMKSGPSRQATVLSKLVWSNTGLTYCVDLCYRRVPILNKFLFFETTFTTFKDGHYKELFVLKMRVIK